MSHALATSSYAPQLAIPADEVNDFYELPDRERTRVQTLLSAFSRIAQADTIMGGCKQVARSLQHLGRGHSAKRIYSLYLSYRKNNCDWRVLVRDYSGCESSMPEAFIRFWVSLVADSPRKDAAKAAYDRLLNEYWFAGKPIPGYGTIFTWWQEHRPEQPMPRGVIVRSGDLPEGWSYENLLRKLPKASATRKLMRQGYHAAHGDMMQLLRDRSGLRPMELITFDDVRMDLQAIFEIKGKLQVAYVNAVFALDVGMGTVLQYGFKPRYQRDDGSHAGIERADVRFLICQILEQRGMPQDYKVNLLLENAAAALTVEDRKAFDQAFPERLQIETTGLVRKQLLSTGFVEQGGMPWQKGWIESYFRLLQTRLSLLPGSTGNRYDNDPGDLPARLSETRKLIKLANANPQKAGEIVFPVLRSDQLHRVLAEIVERLNWRTDHRLQGFDQVHEWRKGTGSWRPIEEMYQLQPSERMADDLEIVARMESPAERERRLNAQVSYEPVHPAVLYGLSAEKRRVTVRNRQVRLTDKGVGLDGAIFDGRDALADKHERTEFLAFLSSERDQLHLFDEAGAYVASLQRQDRVAIMDRKAILEESGRVHRAREAAIEEAASYQERQELELVQMRNRNAALFEDSPLTRIQEAEEAHAKRKAQSRKLSRSDFDAEALLSDDEEPAAHTSTTTQEFSSDAFLDD